MPRWRKTPRGASMTAGSGGGRAGGSKPGAGFDEAATGSQDCRSAGEADSAGTDGVRVEALSRSEAEDGGRDFAHHGRNRQEHAVPGHAEVARGAGGYEVDAGDEPDEGGRSPLPRAHGPKVKL